MTRARELAELAAAMTVSGGDISITNGNLVIGTSGKGIDFSATPGTGTSELLNDYEEGTWTPVLASETTGTQTVTYTVQTGTYTKIGRVVVARFQISWSARTATGAILTVTGLPFAPSSAGLMSGYIDNSANVSFANRNSVTGTQIVVVPYATTIFAIGTIGSSQTGVDNRIDPSALGASGGLNGCVIYQTSSTP